MDEWMDEVIDKVTNGFIKNCLYKRINVTSSKIFHIKIDKLFIRAKLCGL